MPNPQTVSDMIMPNFRLKPEALSAVKAFARSKPWQGNEAEKTAKFKACVTQLCAAYDIAPIDLQYLNHPQSGVLFESSTRIIFLAGKFSVVSMLYAFWYAKENDSRKAHVWAVNVFRKCFPRSFASATQDGIMLRSSNS